MWMPDLAPPDRCSEETRRANIDPQTDRKKTYIELMREIPFADYSVDLMRCP